MDRGVGVLLRVEHPHQQVGELHQPVDLQVVGDLGGVVVGQVEQDHPVERVVLALGVEHRVAPRLVPRRDAEPVQQLVGTLAPPDAGGRPRRGRAAYADRGELEADQRVEGGGLARPGRARRSRRRCGRRTAGAGRPRAARRPRPRRPARRPGGRGRPRPRPPALRSGHRCRCPGSPASWPLRATMSQSSFRALHELRGLEAQVVDPTRRLAHLVGRARLEQQPVEEGNGNERAPRRAKRRRAPRGTAGRARPGSGPPGRRKPPRAASGRSTAEPPAIPASAPVTPAVWANTTIISATESPLTPKARNRAVLRLSAPSLRTISRTSSCQSRTARSARRRRSRDARPRSSPERGQQGPAGVALPPGRLGPLGRRPRRARGSASPARTRPRRSPARPAGACP